MLLFAALGLILWISVLLWRIITKTGVMSVEGQGSDSVWGSPEQGASGAHTPSNADNYSLLLAPSTSLTTKHNNPANSKPMASVVKTAECDPLQTLSEVNSELLPKSTSNHVRATAPMLSSRPEERKRLKFILGASEDYSSDEDLLVTKPPSGVSQASTPKSATEMEPSAVPTPTPSTIK